MIFIEVFRLIFVLIGALVGLEVGQKVGLSGAPAVGTILGALVAYVLGGVIGRYLERQERRAVGQLSTVPPGEFFAGTLVGIAGLLLGLAVSLPLVLWVHEPFLYPVVAAVAWVLGWAGFRIGVVKGRQVVAAAGLTRILAPPTQPPAEYAMLVDSSAIMERSLFVLGRSGFFVGGLVVPRIVIDQVRTLEAGPDPAASRRAGRGLEAIEAMREAGVSVLVPTEELPELDSINDRLIELARRLNLRILTCSGALADAAETRGVAVTDLRRMTDSLNPDLPPGERLSIDLEKQGNQPRQAVGFLPAGDMVVVNDASHLVGMRVPVEVLSTRRTNQGMLVFARLAE